MVAGRRLWWVGAGIAAVAIPAVLAVKRASSRETLAADEVQRLYDRVAIVYDVAAKSFNLFGEHRLRERSVDLLDLKLGDTVVDLGCGTGINLPLLADAVGETGRVIGVDLSSGMLQRARHRADRHGLSQVTVQRGDMRDVRLPVGTAAVLATFSLEMVTEHDTLVRNLADQLAPTHGMLVVAGVRRPPTWPAWIVALGRAATALFGVNRAYEDIRPWRSVLAHLDEVDFETSAAGALYVIAARAHPTITGASPT